MSSGKLRVGVAGLGMGHGHAMACLKSTKVTLAAVADPDVPKREDRLARMAADSTTQAAREIASLASFDSYEQMIDSGCIDAIIVALPNTLHAPASIYAMRKGVHVLCEMPPTNTTAEMKQVAKVAKQTGRTYMFGRQQRFSPVKDAALKVLASGKLGPIYHVETTWMRTNNIPYRQGWGVNKNHGGGVLLDLGVHALDDAWYLMGCPQPVTAFCAMHCGFHHTAANMDLKVPYNADDASFGIVTFAL